MPLYKICNYSPPIGVQLARESHLNSNEGIVAVVGHGLEVAGDAAIGLGVLAVSEAAGDFLLDLAHAQVTFGAVMPTPGLCRIVGAGGPSHGSYDC